ncbi:hypothetical protein CTAYLR_002975 [Chrysophaeum taylorii]|uniref:Glycosyltransferase n=1 Tax=Chrysophaeum taylorii TaxID=2483200 RepID=A0AAD7U5V4_9STRA|nr:hypothetical protein CTAYLR_002975 [Chrysophaeum taylorii]
MDRNTTTMERRSGRLPPKPPPVVSRRATKRSSSTLRVVCGLLACGGGGGIILFMSRIGGGGHLLASHRRFATTLEKKNGTRACAENDRNWGKDPVLKCGFGTNTKSSSTLVAVVSLKGERCDPLSRWKEAEDYDLVVFSDVVPQGPMPWVLVDGSRVAVWNAIQRTARLADYEILILASCRSLASPDAIRAMRDAFDDDSDYAREPSTLVAPVSNRQSRCARKDGPEDDPTTNEESYPEQRVIPLNDFKKKVCVDSSFFAIHLTRVERFAPYLDRLFEEKKIEDATTFFPGDELARRMFAANVPVVVARRALITSTDEDEPLLDVVAPPVVARAAEHAARSYEAVRWKFVANAAIRSCDWPNNYVESDDTSHCKTRCAALQKCKGFSYVGSTSTCYLKSCANRFHDGIAGVDTYVKVAVPVSYRDECVVVDRNDEQATKSPAVNGRRVAIIVTVRDAVEWVLKCVASIFKHADDDDDDEAFYALYLVNDLSTAATLAQLEKLVEHRRPAVRLINWDGAAKLDGYTRAINFGLRAARRDENYDAYCLLNSDAEIVSRRWLDALLGAAFSSPEIGIVGPLSNAASYQSVPNLRDAGINGTTDWSKNELLPGGSWTPVGVDEAVFRASRRALVDVPVLNGFCLLVKRDVVDAVGLMDDVAFPHGFGEENDYCLRAARLGFKLKVVDEAYVWHHKSKSYGDARRVELSKRAKQIMRARWGKQLASAVRALEANIQLRETRRRVATTVHGALGCRQERVLRVLFVLNPIRRRRRGGGKGAPDAKKNDDDDGLAMHGGWISIVNQASGLRQRGACAMVAVSEWTRRAFETNFPDVDPPFLVAYPDNVRAPVDLAHALYPIVASFDILIATLFTTVETVGYLAACHPRLLTAYFIQDYEADFDNLSDHQRQQAKDSYTLVDGMVLFAKTAWLQTKVANAHNVSVAKVLPSLDLSAFDRARRDARDPSDAVRVVAMLRPSTPRRNPLATLRVVADLKRALGNKVSVHTFGCAPEELRAYVAAHRLLSTDWFEHHGTLARRQVADLFAEADVFLDMSFWQAFGRTGLEAMAAGCVPVLPLGSGAEEYATHGHNARLHNTSDYRDAVAQITWLVAHPDRRHRMKLAALRASRNYDLSKASKRMLNLLCGALATKRANLIPNPHPCDASQLHHQPRQVEEDTPDVEITNDPTAHPPQHLSRASKLLGGVKATALRSKLRRRYADGRRRRRPPPSN